MPTNLSKHYEIIILDNEYRDDACRSDEYRINLYKDMWEKFRNIMEKYEFNTTEDAQLNHADKGKYVIEHKYQKLHDPKKYGQLICLSSEEPAKQLLPECA